MKPLAKKSISIVLAAVLTMLLAVTGVGSLIASAASPTAIVFPVNNGCKIAYYYGNTPEYGGSHDGLDIHAGKDTGVYAAVSGKVILTANSCPHINYAKTGEKCAHYNTYGNCIKIQDKDGRSYIYGHLKQNSLLVKTGATVTAGQKIATIGSSGNSFGPHLHFEVRNANGSRINVNPASGNYKYKGKTFTYKNGPYGKTSGNNGNSNNNNNNNNNNNSSNKKNEMCKLINSKVCKERPTLGTKPAASPILNNQTYYIQAGVGSNLYLTNTENKNFGNIALSSTKSAASRWKAISTNGGWVFQNEASKRVMDIYGDSVKSGANLQVYDRNNHKTQLFTVQSSPFQNYYFIKNKGTNLCVDCYGNSGWKSGTNVWVYTNNGDKSQVFQFLRAA